jgi:hypothetical protein
MADTETPIRQKPDWTKDKKTKRLIILLIAIIILCLLALVYFIFIRGNSTLPPDYVPLDSDPNAVQADTGGEKLQTKGGGGAARLMYSNVMTVHLGTGVIDMNYENPGESTVGVVLQLYVGGKLAAQSGALPAGYKLSTMTLQKGVKLQPGKYNGTLSVTFYDEGSGEKSVVNSNINVLVTVVA